VGSQQGAGAQQVGSQQGAGAQQVGSQHPPPQQLLFFLLNSFGILNFGILNPPKQLFFRGWQQQPSLQHAAGAQHTGAQHVGAGVQQGAGAQQVGSQQAVGAQQVGSSQQAAGAQQDGSEEQPPQPLLLLPNRPNRPASALLEMVNTIMAAVRVIPFIVSLLLTR